MSRLLSKYTLFPERFCSVMLSFGPAMVALKPSSEAHPFVKNKSLGPLARHGTGQSRHRAGPRQWTFFGSDGGSKTAAVLRNFIAPCKRCGVESFAWFRDVLARTPAHAIIRLTELLPHNWQPATSLLKLKISSPVNSHRRALQGNLNRHGTIFRYYRGMPVAVNVQAVHPRKLAAVRCEVAMGEVSSAWGAAIGKVWPFIRSQPGLWTNGHNIFLYHHPTRPGAPIQCDFGVEVTRTFETAGDVYATETPGGEAAVAVHRGPYNRLGEAYKATEDWMAVNQRKSAGHSWEIYGDPTPDPADTETTIVHLLK